jgi:hypothetical protein
MNKILSSEKGFPFNGHVDSVLDDGHLVVVQQRIGERGHERFYGHCAWVAAGLVVGEEVHVSIVPGPGRPIVVVETPLRTWNTDLPDISAQPLVA